MESRRPKFAFRYAASSKKPPAMLSLYSGALSLVVSPSVPRTVQHSAPAFMSGDSPAAELMETMIDMVDDLHSVEARKRLPLLEPLIEAAEAKWEGEMSGRIAGLEKQVTDGQAEADALRAQLKASEAKVGAAPPPSAFAESQVPDAFEFTLASLAAAPRRSSHKASLALGCSTVAP